MSKNRTPLHERLSNGLPANKWVDLNEACRLANSTSKSYVKMTLIAMPNVEWRRVAHDTSPLKGAKSEKWIWQFRRVD